MSSIVKITCNRCGKVKKTKNPTENFICSDCKNKKKCIKCGCLEIHRTYNGHKFLCKSCRNNKNLE